MDAATQGRVPSSRLACAQGPWEREGGLTTSLIALRWHTDRIPYLSCVKFL